MSFFNSMDIAATGMTAERFKMDVISGNIANVNTVNTLSGEPYRKRIAVIAPENQPKFYLPCGISDDAEMPAGGGVQVAGVVEDNSPDSFKYVYDPSNPNAEKSGKWVGYVKMPNINIITEMTNLIAASRAFEDNSTVIESAKNMAMKALEIGRS